MDKGMRVLHTANAGVLLNIGRNTIGVDMFSRDPEGLYPDTPPALREELLARIGRGEIDTLLFTHEHGDHFCLEDAAEALRRNPGLTVISTKEVIRQLRGREQHAGRLLEISPDETENVRMELPGFALELFNSRHMGEQYAGVQNLACMLTAGDKKLFLPGDAWPEPELFARVGRWSETIDLFITPFPLVGLPSVRRMIVKSLKIRQVLAVHLPRPEADSQSWLPSAKSVCERKADGIPMPVFAEHLGREYHFF